MNAKIIKTQYIYDLKCNVYIMEKFCDLITSDLITTLTYVLMEYFCPCFNLGRYWVKENRFSTVQKE